MNKMVFFPLLFILSLSHLTQKSLAEIHVRIKNELSGDAMKVKVHCQAGDQSLGTQTIVKGMAIEWRIKADDKAQRQIRDTPYFCDVQWNEIDGYHFEAYSEGKYHQRCQSACTWHVTEQGPLLQNQKTGSWEPMPFNPLPGKKERQQMEKMAREDMVFGVTHVTTPHKCICWPPTPEH